MMRPEVGRRGWNQNFFCQGYSQNDFFLTCKGWAIGLGLSLVICIPDWPFFNRNKVVWSDEVGKLAPTAKESKNKATTPKSSSGKKKSTKTN
eukprot:scaffold1290_cov248-Ochromonas_danica.AAC.25